MKIDRIVSHKVLNDKPVIRIYFEDNPSDNECFNFIKYIEAYDRDNQLCHKAILKTKINNELALVQLIQCPKCRYLLYWTDIIFDNDHNAVSCKYCEPKKEKAETCGATSRLNHVCQKPKGHDGLHHNYTDGVTWAVNQESPKVETVPCKHCEEPIKWHKDHWDHKRSGVLSCIDGKTTVQPNEPDTVLCKNCDMSIEWNQGDTVWRHNHNKSLFCNINKLDTVAQPNEPLDFGLTEDDKTGVKENEALFVASFENTAEKTEFTKPLEAWAMPDGSIETRISNGSQTFVLNKINAEGKLEISDEFAEAIKSRLNYITHEEVNKFATSDEFIEYIKAKIIPEDTVCVIMDKVTAENNPIPLNCLVIETEDGLQLSNEFVDAIKARITPKVDTVEDSEMPICDKRKILDVGDLRYVIDDLFTDVKNGQMSTQAFKEALLDKLIHLRGESNDKC